MGYYLTVEGNRAYLNIDGSAVVALLRDYPHLPEPVLGNGRIYFEFDSRKGASRGASLIGSFLSKLKEGLRIDERHPEFVNGNTSLDKFVGADEYLKLEELD